MFKDVFRFRPDGPRVGRWSGRSAFLLSILFLSIPFSISAQEICNNGVDDDADGNIDLNDAECDCAYMIDPENVPSFIVNHSFEDQDCCPYGYSTPGQNWLDCAAYWNQATVATSDYYHECGFSPEAFPLPPPDGEGSVGFISTIGYMEYVGACLTFPGPPNPLLAGTTYTLSFWIAGLSISATDFIGDPHNLGVYYDGQFPLALFGNPVCQPFPIGTLDCIGYEPGWQELARIYHQPNGDWSYVSMTFTPTVDISTVILGSACDLPSTFESTAGSFQYQGQTITMQFYPYTMVDELNLTLASDQVLTPVAQVGHVCTDDVIVTATPPAGASGHQWYLDGIAIAGQTDVVLNVSALGLSSGTYTMTSLFEGQCLRGSINVPPPIVPAPLFSLDPAQGCAPLTVTFSDTTGLEGSTIEWDFGDGSSATGPTVSHTYTSEGSYDLTVRVISGIGCERDSILPDAVVVSGGPIGSISATPDPATIDDPVVGLSGTGSIGNIISWWWDLDMASPPSSTGSSVTATFPAQPGDYDVMLVVIDAAGCIDTVHSVITIVDPEGIEMPNIFSPNGDGENDTFSPLEYSGVPALLEIFNRWGQLIYSTTSVDRGWNGSSSGSDLPEGTYYYILTTTSEPFKSYKGHLTLVK